MPRRTETHPLALAVGARVRKLRAEAGLTLEGLAAEVSENYSKGHLSSLEQGLVVPTVATLDALATALGVLVVDLVNDPAAGDRQKVIELTRSLKPGTLRRLVKELSEAAPVVKKPAG